MKLLEDYAIACPLFFSEAVCFADVSHLLEQIGEDLSCGVFFFRVAPEHRAYEVLKLRLPHGQCTTEGSFKPLESLPEVIENIRRNDVAAFAKNFVFASRVHFSEVCLLQELGDVAHLLVVILPTSIGASKPADEATRLLEDLVKLNSVSACEMVTTEPLPFAPVVNLVPEALRTRHEGLDALAYGARLKASLGLHATRSMGLVA